MSGIDQQVSPYRVVWLDLTLPRRPVLYATDTEEILRDSGQQVVARIRHYCADNANEMRLCLKVKPDCPYAVLYDATLQALTRIYGNSIHAGQTPGIGALGRRTMPDMATQGG